METQRPKSVHLPESASAWSLLENVAKDIEGADLLLDLLQELVIEESHGREGRAMEAHLQGQVICLFDAIKTRLVKANEAVESLFAVERGRDVAEKLRVTATEATEVVRDLRSRRSS